MKTTTELTLQLRRKRRFLLILPAIVLPFITLLFWTLGGAKGSTPRASTHKGLSMHLPNAVLGTDSAADKLAFYDRARADSIKQAQLRKTDPYAIFQHDTATQAAGLVPGEHATFGTAVPTNDPQLQASKINQRLNQLQAVLNKPEPAKEKYNQHRTQAASYTLPERPKVTEDPELKQMNSMLEKILDIQHPDRTREKAATAQPALTEKFKAIPAIVDGNQKIIQGSVIRLKLLDSVRLNGQLFAKGQLIYGTGDLFNQRVKINIKLIHAGLHIIPVDLTVYDRTDGLEGISVPEAITGDAMRDGAVAGVQNMELMSFDPSMSAQLATAGINTAKGLFSKKVKRVKGKLKNGHELLLRDNQLLKAGNK